MLCSFTVTNFLSFKEPATLNFVMAKNAPSTNRYQQLDDGTKIAKVKAIVGANSSGKSNILKALSFFNSMISGSEMEESFFEPYLLTEPVNPVSTMLIEFLFEGTIHQIELSFSKECIMKEVLRKKTSSKFSTEFYREWTGENYYIKPSGIGKGLPSELGNSPNLTKQSIIPILRMLGMMKLPYVQLASSLETTLIVPKDYFNFHQFGLNLVLPMLATENIRTDEEMKSWVTSTLCKLDLGISGLGFVKFNTEGFAQSDKEMYLPIMKRTLEGKEYNISYNAESEGTKNLYNLLPTIYKTLQSGSILVADELDASIHPHLLRELIALFYDPQLNQRGAQLIFSSHSMDIFTYLDKYEVTLVEKVDNCSEIYGLDEIEGVRNDENHYAKYMAGVYGGLPNLEL